MVRGLRLRGIEGLGFRLWGSGFKGPRLKGSRAKVLEG